MPTWPINTIRELLEPTLAHMGYDLYALEQAGTSGRTLRIAIDRPQGITIDDCQRVSSVAGPLLDQADLIPGGRYELEVSSPGQDRPLTKPQHFTRFLGRRARVRLREARGGHKSVTGELVGASERDVTIAADGGVVTIPYEQIARSNLVPGD